MELNERQAMLWKVSTGGADEWIDELYEAVVRRKKKVAAETVAGLRVGPRMPPRWRQDPVQCADESEVSPRC